MISMNDHGGAEKRVALIKRGVGNIQHVMLNTILIHKADNWHLQCGRYITNSLPEIMIPDETVSYFKIRPRFGTGIAITGAGQTDGYATGAGNPGLVGNMMLSVYKFNKTRFYGIAGFCEKIAEYFRTFNYYINIFGANNGLYVPNDVRIIPDAGFIQGGVVLPFDSPNRHAADQIVDYISAGFDESGHLTLNLSSLFLANFWIELEPIFAKRIGFPVSIYNDAQFISNQPGVTDLLTVVAPISFAIDIGQGVQLARTIFSKQSIFEFDDRLSIDIEISLPLSQTIDVENSKEKHNFLLSRFVISDYKYIETRAQQRKGVVLSKAIIQDTLALGIHDLVQNTPEAHTTQLLPGKIQVLDSRLLYRYRSYSLVNDTLESEIKTKIFSMQKYGVYDILLEFNKKV
jgi:hypothetical protein